MKSFLVIFFLMCSFLIGNVSYREFVIEEINTTKGLSDKTVTNILQDKDGYMWFGTESGLNKYDGYNFKIFINDPKDPKSIPFNRITALLENTKGELWIGTGGGGVCRYNREGENFSIFLPEPDSPQSKANNILTIYEDSEQVLWIGTWGEGFFRFDPIDGHFSQFKPEINNSESFMNRIHHIFESKKGDMLIATGEGLLRFYKEKGKFKKIEFKKNIDFISSNNQVLTVYEDKAGEIWVGTYKGFFKLSIENNRVYLPDYKWVNNFKGQRVYKIIEDNYGRMWIGTWSGLYQVDKEKKNIRKYSIIGQRGATLSSKFIFDIYIDKAEIFWIGTMNGINKFNGRSSGFKNYDLGNLVSKERSALFYMSIYEDSENTLWIGTLQNGLIRFNKDTGNILSILTNNKKNNSLSSNTILFIAEFDHRYIFIGTEMGLNIFDKKTEKIEIYRNSPGDPESLYNDVVVDVEKYKPGIFFVGTLKGLSKFDRRSGKFKRYLHDPDDPDSISCDLITSILKDREGNIWVGTYGGGLNRLVPETDSFVHIKETEEKCIRKKYIYPIFESSSGMLWMGSYEGGLKRYDPKKDKFKNYYIEDGLASNTVWDISEDNLGNIWFNTPKGLSKLGRNNVVTNYFENDGILVNFITFNTVSKSNNGEIIFSGENGFITLNPNKIKKKVYCPKVGITRITKLSRGSIENISLDSDQSFNLSFSDKMVTFDFSVMSFINPLKNKYKYKLSGLDEAWVDLENRHSVSFANLDPGDYEFKVIGCDQSLCWNTKGVSVRFSVIPPFWRTKWFIFIIVIILITCFIVFHKYRLKKQEKRLRNEVEMENLFRKKGISKREREIVLLVLSGRTSKEIEEKLFISYGTVKNHIYNIYKKLKIKNRAELVNLFKNINNL